MGEIRKRPTAREAGRAMSNTTRGWITALLLLIGAALSGAGPARAQEQPIVIDAIEIQGNDRTSRDTIYRYLPLRPGDRVPADSVLAAVEALRASQLFDSVGVTSRRGGERGHAVVELGVRERGIDLSFGAGYQDLSGWYLIPAQLRLDNRLGAGEKLGLQLRIGYRALGLYLDFLQPHFGDGANYLGVGLATEGVDRLYFSDGISYTHHVDRQSAGLRLGRRLTPRFTAEVGAGLVGVHADSSAEVMDGGNRPGVGEGDALPYDRLPAGVAVGVGSRTRELFHGELTWDSRAKRRVVATPAAGVWGRVRLEENVGEAPAYSTLTADLRAYRAAGPLAFATRWRGGVQSAGAPFYDRFYVGGLYTVRGFPDQAKTNPGGDTRFWSATVEMRAPLIGRTANPRLSGLLFVDGAQSFSGNAPRLDEVAVAAGWGIRYRLGWFGWLGLDTAIPLTPGPLKEAYRVHGSLGMTF